MWDNILEVKPMFIKSLQETLFMVSISLVISILLGLVLGLFLYLTTEPLFFKKQPVYQILSTVTNIVSSIPFLILMIFLLPLSAIIVGTKIGSSAVIVPLSVAAIAFFGRLAEASFSDVDRGVLEAVISSGAKKSHVILKVLLPEARISLVKNITVTAITVLGFSAMAGLVGGGGIGDLAYRYGYQRYQQEIMVVCILLLIVLVQVIQLIGNAIVKHLGRKVR